MSERVNLISLSSLLGSHLLASRKNMETKVMKNGLGEWGVWWKVNLPNEDTKFTNLAYRRFFKTKEMGEKWAEKFKKKMLK